MPDIFVAKHKEVPKGEKRKRNKLTHFKNFVKKFTQSAQSFQKTESNLKIFSAFCTNPTGISFEEMDEDEKILLFLRRHIITNFLWVATTIILLLIPLFFVFLNFSNINLVSSVNLPLRFTFFFAVFYYLIVLTFALVNFISWYFNVSIITDKRIFDVDFSELVYKNVSATKFDLLQDASYAQTGFLRTLFNYGDVLLQTAGKKEEFNIQRVPHPDKVVHLVENLLGRKGKI